MKKWIVILGAVALLIGGCGSREGGEAAQPDVSQTEAPLAAGTLLAEAREGDFVLQLETEKARYRKGEPVKLKARLKYDGPLPEVTIGHAFSPISFPIRETTRGIEIAYPMPMPLIRTTLKQGEWFEEAYSKAGGYGDQDPDKDFMKQFLSGEGFPEGRYEIAASAGFELYEGEPDAPGTKEVDYGIHTEKIRIDVE